MRWLKKFWLGNIIREWSFKKLIKKVKKSLKSLKKYDIFRVQVLLDNYGKC